MMGRKLWKISLFKKNLKNAETHQRVLLPVHGMFFVRVEEQVGFGQRNCAGDDQAGGDQFADGAVRRQICMDKQIDWNTAVPLSFFPPLAFDWLAQIAYVLQPFLNVRLVHELVHRRTL